MLSSCRRSSARCGQRVCLPDGDDRVGHLLGVIEKWEGQIHSISVSVLGELPIQHLFLHVR